MNDETETDGGVVRLPVQHKAPPNEERMLVAVPYANCQHLRGPYTVDVKAGKCVCRQCGCEVSPMFVLEQLMHEESQWMSTRRAYQAEMERLGNRSRTKCHHCGKLTRISRS